MTLITAPTHTTSIPRMQRIYQRSFTSQASLTGSNIHRLKLKECWVPFVGKRQAQCGHNLWEPSNQEMFKESSLDISHAELVNQSWKFGGMERSLKFIHCCIQNFSSTCLLDLVGRPVSWILMDQIGESRMAGTGAKYWGKGLMTYVFYTHTHNIKNFNLPLYLHVEKINQIMIKTVLCMNCVHIPRTWNQWNCEPTDASSEMVSVSLRL